MSYVCVIKHSSMNNNKKTEFSTQQQQLANFAKVLSHPARIAIIELLAQKKEIKTGYISDFLPISRTTVSQHLKELKEMGLIKGTIDGHKIHYCLNEDRINEINVQFNGLLLSCISNFKCEC